LPGFLAGGTESCTLFLFLFPRLNALLTKGKWTGWFCLQSYTVHNYLPVRYRIFGVTILTLISRVCVWNEAGQCAEGRGEWGHPGPGEEGLLQAGLTWGFLGAWTPYFQCERLLDCGQQL
jgi:hypothetical protein